MTCIVAYHNGKSAWMGGDKAACTQFEGRSISGSKVFKRGRMMVGFTTSFRMAQIIAYHVDFPDFERHIIGGEGYLVKNFIPGMRKQLKEHGFTTISNNEEIGGEILIALPDGIYNVQSDFSIIQYVDSFSSIGSGMYYALGAMRAQALAGIEQNPIAMIDLALRTAAYFDPFVRGPFPIERVDF